MNLLEVKTTKQVKVLEVDCGQGMARNLACLGIHAGDTVTVVRRAPFRGPILVHVESTGVNIAVGREMARRISVEAERSREVS